MDQKVLCVYYSRSGNTKQVIEQLTEKLPCDVEHIGEPRKRKGVIGFLRSGFEAATKKIVSIDEQKHDPSSYDLVIIATPMWASTVSSPVRSYLYQNKGKFKKQVAYIVTSGYKASSKVCSQLDELTNLTPKTRMELKHKDFKMNTIDQAIDQFIQNINES
ncbi:flavodoxin family protein [Haloplasma contractile]|uniref:Flavodoxin FldA protein n=1 Tax=Haloplasma contractile SSD-17B TaxID=1033810 RepID=F7PUF8_9MOLU|nr:hypothetical protein [Haloplasma contractile]ERJ11769.1 Flavodoxin FldA protein [Haloplasma contractile SSD-17B]